MSRAGPSELPPILTVEPAAPPPLRNPAPTAAQLKGDIESGRTRQEPVRDPALAPLGTDDEAAGRPPSPLRVALARHSENLARWMRGGGRSGASRTVCRSAFSSSSARSPPLSSRASGSSARASDGAA